MPANKKLVGAKARPAKAARPTKSTPPTKSTRPTKRPTKAKTSTRAKKKAAAKPAQRSFGPKMDSLPDWLVEAFAPTIRVYAEEEARVLAIASAHPALGERFAREAAARTNARVPKKDLAAFREAMAKVDVEARVRVVVKKLEKAWGSRLDDETRENVREDVLAMYVGA